MEKVKIPILLLHLICTWGDIFVSVLSTPVFLFPSTAGYPLGVLYYVMPTWLICYLGFAIILFVGPSVILLFENRYNLLVREDSESSTRKVKRFLHHLFNCVFTLLIVVPPFSNLFDFPNFREMVHQEIPCLPERVIQHPRLYYLNTNARTIIICLFSFLVLVVSQWFYFLIATESEEFYATLLHFISIVQAPIHFFGIYIILKRTPKSMEKVKYSILLLHLQCAWCDIFVSCLSTPVFFFPATAGYPLGILYHFLPTWLLCYIGFVSLFLIGSSQTLVFENRYNILVREDSESSSRKVKRLFHHLFNFLFIILIVVPPFRIPVHIPNFREIIHQGYPCLPEKIIQHPQLFLLNTDAPTIFVCLFCCLLFTFTQLLYFLFATTLHLSKTQKSRSSRTSQLQNQFFKAMCIQICLPFIVIGVPAMYVLYIFASGYLNLAFDNLCVISFTSHGAFSTIVMLIVHEPYRSATLQILRIRRTETPKPVRLCFIGCPNV
ncbi:unnamed protein product [Caenorhabditis nigoni]